MIASPFVAGQVLAQGIEPWSLRYQQSVLTIGQCQKKKGRKEEIQVKPNQTSAGDRTLILPLEAGGPTN